ncbi:translation initiation factor IF-2 [Rhodoligotrophos defluvii]|uniref:translation initiation factor IF-2 n=1 Tax=Rhodoligotrophos defluvii TaxID=2561934 RepID=UPI0010C9DED4|nr:translation initiation factor IF-2 [Rhodoligotrophos defluvii]
MTDTKDTDNTTAGGGRTLSLRRSTVEQSRVKQNFSHGRTKQVVVEKKRKRVLGPGTPGARPDLAGQAEAAPQQRRATAPATPPAGGAQARPAQVHAPQPAAQPADETRGDQRRSAPGRDGGAGRSGVVLRTLTEEEREARSQALAEARVRDAEERRRAEEEARRRAEIEEQERREREAEERRRAEEARLREAEAGKAEVPQTEATPQQAPAAPEPAAAPAPHAARTGEQRPAEARKTEARPAAPAVQPKAVEVDDEEDVRGRGKAKREVKAPTRVKTDIERRRGRLTIGNALSADEDRERSLASMRRRQERQKKQAGQFQQSTEKIVRDVIIPEAITIQELASRMAERAVDVIKYLMRQGQMHKINDIIDADTAQLIAEEMGHRVKRVSEADVEEGLMGVEDTAENTQPRAPVVTVMGHVDHGKTSLLDAIRHADVAAGEAGGITQHIGAYQVETPSGMITFIDTPGHAAFTAMRARGAKVTDIVVLVVAADDGVMPQTIEAINHARAAHVPLIVAINKIDKPDSDPNRVRTDLLRHEVVVESMGGDTLEVEVSALKGTNLDKLLETILLQAELLELRANPDRPADGTVVEAQLDKGRGPVATVLIQRGTLRVGDIFVAGTAWGRVRALVNDRGVNIMEAGPSVPVEVLGLGSTPEAGDQFVVVDSEGRAREITEYRERKRRELKGVAPSARASLEQMMSQLREGARKEVPVVIKGDVQGSAEAIVQALEKLGNEEVTARVLLYGVGGITESDVTLAAASGAVILGFNVRANAQARVAAEQAGIEIRYYNVIYDLVDDVKRTMSGLLAPELREEFLGNAEVLEIFNISKVGKIAGCRVTDGTVQRGAKVRLIRNNVVIHEGTLSTLKRFKDEVREVVAGQECGMAFEGYQDMRPGDVIECYRVETIARTLD